MMLLARVKPGRSKHLWRARCLWVGGEIFQTLGHRCEKWLSFEYMLEFWNTGFPRRVSEFCRIASAQLFMAFVYPGREWERQDDGITKHAASPRIWRWLSGERIPH